MNRHISVSVDVQAFLDKVLQAAADYEDIEGYQVAVSLVDDARIHELNREYRGVDRPTDVLSFALQEQGEDEPEFDYGLPEHANEWDSLGDIVISIETMERQAAEYGHSVERELAFLAVHGFLHLIGYDHETEEEEKDMFRRQEDILKTVGLTRD
ncbi:rRNA maturation RNase YbeY [Fodinisporobacter ferrooxydans]|uniref:Endoribonuclease YbeY n=1 Tax=Fodinisporobacter ferrooxydans TaxID=2901836 RepID=A0ABY4CQT5_9BACL|nr:rRNA maturation RNase YbeY [Alicyclobacillaceae bacterium MYW30-H2]